MTPEMIGLAGLYQSFERWIVTLFVVAILVGLPQAVGRSALVTSFPRMQRPAKNRTTYNALHSRVEYLLYHSIHRSASGQCLHPVVLELVVSRPRPRGELFDSRVPLAEKCLTRQLQPHPPPSS